MIKHSEGNQKPSQGIISAVHVILPYMLHMAIGIYKVDTKSMFLEMLLRYGYVIDYHKYS